MADEGMGFGDDANLYRDRGLVTYDDATDLSTIVLPYYLPDDGVIIRSDTMETLVWTRIPDTLSVTVRGDMTEVPMYAGVPYEFRYRFGPATLRKQTSTGGLTAVKTGRLQLLRWSVSYASCGPFDMEVHRDQRESATKRIVPRRLATAINNSPATDKASVLVRSRAERCRVDLVNDMHWPSWFQTAAWSGEYTRDDELI